MSCLVAQQQKRKRGCPCASRLQYRCVQLWFGARLAAYLKYLKYLIHRGCDAGLRAASDNMLIYFQFPALMPLFVPDV